MSCEIIRGVILQDTLSIAASTVFINYNPGHWTSPSSVPRYLYTCIQDMASAYGNITNYVNIDYGQADLPASFCIIIQESDTCESSNYPEFMDATGILGATFMHVDILVSNPKTSIDVHLIRDVGLRIRYLLDNQLRGLEGNAFTNASGYLDPIDPITLAYDPTITPTYYKIKWDQSDILRAKQQAHHLTAAFIRTFV